MKILICLSPQLRPHAHLTVRSLVENVILPLPAKPDLLAWLTPGAELPPELLQSCGKHWVYCNPDPDLPEGYAAWERRLEKTNSLRNNLLQWLALKHLGQVKSEIEQQHGTYDLVIWSRPDLYFVNRLNLATAEPVRGLWISPHDNWHGYNDRFCFGSSEDMSVRFSIYDFFAEIAQQKDEQDGALWNAEMILQAHLARHNLIPNRTDLIFCRVRDNEGTPFAMLPDPRGMTNALFSADDSLFDQAAFARRLQRLTDVSFLFGETIKSNGNRRFIKLKALESLTQRDPLLA